MLHATFCPILLHCGGFGAGMVARRAEKQIKALYDELNSTHVFIPIAIETLGVFGDDTLAFLKEV